MQSDKYVCVRDVSSQPPQAVIVEVDNPSNVVKFPVTADSVLVHPQQKILSLRGSFFLIFFKSQHKKLIILFQLHKHYKSTISMKELN